MQGRARRGIIGGSIMFVLGNVRGLLVMVCALLTLAMTSLLGAALAQGRSSTSHDPRRVGQLLTIWAVRLHEGRW